MNFHFEWKTDKIIYTRYTNHNFSWLGNWFFGNFTLDDKPFPKSKFFGTCVSVNKNLCGKVVLPLELSIWLAERLKVLSVPFLFPILTC